VTADIHLDLDELVPQEGKDDEYDKITAEIRELEEDLEAELKVFKERLRYAIIHINFVPPD
jgi:hypothetical protein